MLRLNTNDTVLVRPTPEGWNRLRIYFDELNLWHRVPKPDANGYIRIQLHEVMEYFGGRDTGMGCPLLVETVFYRESEKIEKVDPA